MMRAQQWRIADEYERESHFAMMREQAHRAKRPKASDLYRHPSRKKAGDITDMKEKTRADNEWLSRLVSAGRKE